MFFSLEKVIMNPLGFVSLSCLKSDGPEFFTLATALPYVACRKEFSAHYTINEVEDIKSNMFISPLKTIKSTL